MAKTAMPSTSGGDTIAWLSLLCPPCFFFSELHDEHTRTSSALKGSSSSSHSLLAPPPLPAAHISSSSLRRLRSRRRRRLQLTDPNCNPSPPTSPPPSTSPPLLSFSLVLSLSPTAPKSSSLGEARPPPPLFPDSPPSSSFPSLFLLFYPSPPPRFSPDVQGCITEPTIYPAIILRLVQRRRERKGKGDTPCILGGQKMLILFILNLTITGVFLSRGTLFVNICVELPLSL